MLYQASKGNPQMVTMESREHRKWLGGNPRAVGEGLGSSINKAQAELLGHG
jgi:hypothetical protein